MQQELANIRKKARELKQVGRYTDALRLRQDLEKLYKVQAVEVAEQSSNLNWIAYLAIRVGNLDEAERAARKCVEVYRPFSTAIDQKLSTYLMMLSSVLAERRKFHEAVAFGDEAVALFVRILGEGNPFVTERKRDIERMRGEDLHPYLDK